MKTAAQQPAKQDEHREWFDKEVEFGFADIEAGRIVSHDEMREHNLLRPSASFSIEQNRTTR